MLFNPDDLIGREFVIHYYSPMNPPKPLEAELTDDGAFIITSLGSS